MIHWFDLFAISVAVGVGVTLLRPKLRDSKSWRATVTPLASIIGSGFLIVAPMLAYTTGSGATLAMTGIVGLSLWIGSALRYNIRFRPLTSATPSGATLESVANLVLAAAYTISIAFYIRLLAAFVLTGLDSHSELAADLMSSGILLFIGLYGSRYGLRGLERLEEYSVTIKLSIIAALLLWLLQHDFANHLVINGLDIAPFSEDPLSHLRILGGMLLVVQGFEASKYLGADYSPALRSRTMLRAQIIAGCVYIGFVALVTPLMSQISASQVSETAIIEMTRIVTPLLPPLLIIAAVMSQFSASVADTIGAGGVVQQESKNQVPISLTYPLLTGVSIVLIWTSNIYEIVSYASRAFALYYTAQTVLAAWSASNQETGWLRWWLIVSYTGLASILALVVLFALPMEG